MIGGDVERLEVVEVVFDLGAGRHVEARLPEQLLDPQAHLRYRMQSAARFTAARQGDVDAFLRQLGGNVRLFEFEALGFDRRLDLFAHPVEAFAPLLALGLGELPETLELRGQPAALAERAHTRILESGNIRALGDCAERLGPKLVEILGGLAAHKVALRGFVECGLCLLRDARKRIRLIYGEVGKHLAIDFDLGLLEAVDDLAVAQSEFTRGGVDAGDPERAEIALLGAAIPIRVLAGLDDGLLRSAEYLAAGVVVALRLAQNFLVTA